MQDLVSAALVFVHKRTISGWMIFIFRLAFLRPCQFCCAPDTVSPLDARKMSWSIHNQATSSMHHPLHTREVSFSYISALFFERLYNHQTINTRRNGYSPVPPSPTTLREKTPMLSEQSFEKQSSVFFKEVSAESDYPKEDLTLKPLSYRRSVYLAHPKSTKRSLPLDQFFEACASQAPFVKAAVVTFVTGVPFLVFLLITLYALPKKTILGPPGSKATIFELSKWLLISWASFMGLLWCGKILAAISTWCCTLSKSWIKFQRLTQTICLRMVLMLWAIVCYAVIPSVFHHSLGTKGIVEHWVQMLQKAFKFLIIAFAIFLVQGIVLELSSIQYIQGWMGPRSQRACDELDTIKQLHELTDPHVSSGNAGYVTKVLKKLLLPVRNDDLYYRISCGQGHPEMWAEYANYIWDSISQGKATVTRFDVDEQLRAMNRDHDPSRGRELFIQLDDSCDGQVILGEVEKLVQRVGLQLNTRAQAQRGIDSLLRKLEVILSVVMCGIIFFVYGKLSPAFDEAHF